jgi:predicted nucleotidyltransferase
MAFGFSKQDQERILSALQKFPEIEKTVIFGSRAMGNFKKASDVDLAIVGKNITSKTVIRLHSLLNEELPLPYFFDVVVYEKIANDKLKRHIIEHGVELFPAQSG